ncbi:hypothetical protein VP01_3883g1, partial [Puccinia sorghi]
GTSTTSSGRRNRISLIHTFKREKHKDNKMTATIDGGELLPPSSIIITYILREVQQASFMKRRQEMRRQMKENTPTVKKNRNQQEVMDVDDEITQIANKPLSKIDPGTPVFQPNKSKVRFQNPSTDSQISKFNL